MSLGRTQLLTPVDVPQTSETLVQGGGHASTGGVWVGGWSLAWMASYGGDARVGRLVSWTQSECGAVLRPA